MAQTKRVSETAAGGANGGVRRMVSQVAEDVAELSGTARRAIGETAHKAGEVVHDLADEAAVRGKRVATAAVHEVREHPVRSIAIGAAVGVLVAAFLSRRRTRD